jgi:hypothetical protein
VSAVLILDCKELLLEQPKQITSFQEERSWRAGVVLRKNESNVNEINARDRGTCTAERARTSGSWLDAWT